MITHILKLIWNKRKSYVWIFIELILVFVILFYCLVQTGIKMEYYFDPSNLNTENVYSIWGQMDEAYLDKLEDRSEFWGKYTYVENKMKASKYVVAVHEGAQTMPESSQAQYNRKDSIEANGRKVLFFPKSSDGNLQRVFRFDMIEGEWFEDKQLPDGTYPVVLTESLVADLGYAHPMGAKLSYKKRDFTVTGVMHDYKSFMFDESMPAAIFAKSAFGERDLGETFAMYRIKDGMGDEFVSYFWTEMMREFPSGGIHPATYDLGASTRDSKVDSFMQLFVIFIPTLFLIVFAFIGTYSLNNRQTKKSTGEYGLRMAMGSTGAGIEWLVIKQNLLLIGFALLIGSIIALNLYRVVFPETGTSIVVPSLIVSALLMVAFTLVSVLPPARRASRLHPSEALRQQE